MLIGGSIFNTGRIIQKKEQDLLDFIAPEVPEQNGWDKYEKFLNFVRFAYKEKMITESELRSLTDLHRVVNP